MSGGVKAGLTRCPDDVERALGRVELHVDLLVGRIGQVKIDELDELLSFVEERRDERFDVHEGERRSNDPALGGAKGGRACQLNASCIHQIRFGSLTMRLCCSPRRRRIRGRRRCQRPSPDWEEMTTA